VHIQKLETFNVALQTGQFYSCWTRHSSNWITTADAYTKGQPDETRTRATTTTWPS